MGGRYKNENESPVMLAPVMNLKDRTHARCDVEHTVVPRTRFQFFMGAGSLFFYSCIKLKGIFTRTSKHVRE